MPNKSIATPATSAEDSSAAPARPQRPSKRPASPIEDIEAGDEDEGDESEPKAESSTAAAARKAAKKAKKSKSAAPAPTAGIVYISRLPPGMTHSKVRHLMEKWGEVGKVYAQRRDAPTGYNPNSSSQKKPKHQRADYTEAWVEFLDKSVAKTVARMLNAQVIGGKKGDRWRDDIWTMRYLSGFKWEMLGEQVAYEKQSHQARLRNEISRAKTEQGEYLRNVELARVLEKRKQKKIAAGQGSGQATATGEGGAGQSSESAGEGPGKGGKAAGSGAGYRQRQAVDRSQGMSGQGIEAVLGSVFG